MNINTQSYAIIQQCFERLYDPQSTPKMRNQTDHYLRNLESNCQQLVATLLLLFQNEQRQIIRFQALLYLSNVIKRNWCIRKKKQNNSQFIAMKATVKDKILRYLEANQNKYSHTLWNIIQFICKVDYPFNYIQFTEFVMNLLNNIQITSEYATIIKNLSKVYIQLISKKGSIALKTYEQHCKPIIGQLASLSEQFLQQIQKYSSPQIIPNKNVISINKSIDTIFLSLMCIAPTQILDYSQTSMIMEYYCCKLQKLITLHGEIDNTKNRKFVQKNIKCLLLYLWQFQIIMPFAFAFILEAYFATLKYIIINPNKFSQSLIIKYTLLALRQYVKQFSYYSQSTLFNTSIVSKPKSNNYMNLREICHKIYYQTITNENIQQFMSVLLSTIMCMGSHQQIQGVYEETFSIEKGLQKQLSIFYCSMTLIYTLLQRFYSQTSQLIINLTLSSHRIKWSNLNPSLQKNVLSILSLLPRMCKQTTYQINLLQIPILQILSYTYTNLTSVFPSLLSGWFQIFSPQQLQQLITFLLGFMTEQKAQLQTILQCCNCLNRILHEKCEILDTNLLMNRVLPYLIDFLTSISNPELLWPVINLLTTIIQHSNFNSELILQNIEEQKFKLLINNQSSMLIQALCQMFRHFICVIPRHQPAQAVYQLIYLFLNKHLETAKETVREKVLQLWYIAIRQYSSIQYCDNQYFNLFQTHFKRMLVNKNAILVYILEQYMLLGLIQAEISDFLQIIYEFYTEAAEMSKEDKQSMKIATMSFQITLITIYQLHRINSSNMLKVIINDLSSTNHIQASSTLQNSLLSIVNRYIILYRGQFINFLNSIPIDLNIFFYAYFDNMNHLTSRTAMKINAIALLMLIDTLDSNIVTNKLDFMLKLIIPEVQLYLQCNDNGITTPQIIQSPSIRFSNSVLSQRKQQMRKKGTFSDINLQNLFKNKLNIICQKFGWNISVIIESMDKYEWRQRMHKIII